jgi:hypothetical protein
MKCGGFKTFMMEVHGGSPQENEEIIDKICGKIQFFFFLSFIPQAFDTAQTKLTKKIG